MFTNKRRILLTMVLSIFVSAIVIQPRVFIKQKNIKPFIGLNSCVVAAEADEETIRTGIDEGRRYYRQRQYKKAIEEWEKTLKLDPENVKIKKYIERAQAKLGEAEGTKPETTAETVAPGKPDTQTKVNELIDAGRNFYREGKYEEALNVWQEAYKLDPENKNISRYLIKVKEKVKIKEEQPEPIAGEEEIPQAAPAAVPPAPEGADIEGMVSRGKEYFRQGDYPKAIAEWEKALLLQPGNEKIQKYIEKARKNLEEAVPAEEEAAQPVAGEEAPPAGPEAPPAGMEEMPQVPSAEGIPSMEELAEEEEEEEGIVRRDLAWCVKIAIENHREAKIALEKIKKAEIDLFIARRNFFPNLFFSYGEAQGGSGADINAGEFRSTRDYVRQRYKFQARHLVYSGGKVRYEVQKAHIALDLEKKDYDRVVSQKALEVAKAYYEVARTEADLKLQRKLLKDCQASLKLVEDQFKSGLVSELELLNLKALINEVLSKTAQAQQEVSHAVLDLQKVMNIDITTPIRVYALEEREISLDDRYKDIPLIKNVQAFQISGGQGVDERNQLQQDSYAIYALKTRADFVVERLKLQKAQKEVDIAKTAFRPQFEVYGEVGEGAEENAQRVSQLDMKEEHVAGIRLSWNIWGNTFAVRNEEKKEAPTVTQIAVPRTREWMAEVGLLDNLQPMSEKQELVVKRMEALNDLANLKNTIIEEVRDAYHNFLKAKISKDTAKSKIEFKKKNVDLYNLQRSLGEIDTSKLVQAEIDLAAEKNALNKALADYYVQLASLDSSIGKDIFYRAEETKSQEIAEAENEAIERENEAAEAENETVTEAENEAAEKDNEAIEKENEAVTEAENETAIPAVIEEPEPQPVTCEGYIFKLEEVTVGPATHKIVKGYKYRKWVALARSLKIDLNEYIGKRVRVTGIPVKTEDWIDTVIVQQLSVIGKRGKIEKTVGSTEENEEKENEADNESATESDNDSKPSDKKQDTSKTANPSGTVSENDNESTNTADKPKSEPVLVEKDNDAQKKTGKPNKTDTAIEKENDAKVNNPKKE